MKKLLTTLAVLTVVATPAFAAQSDQYHRAYRGDAANAYGWENSGVPSTTQNDEEIRLDHAKGDIGQ